MAADAAKIRTGPAAVYLDGTELGHTEGDVTVNFGLQKRERLVSKYGENPVDQIHLGHKVTVTFSIAEYSLANAQLWFPGAQVVSNTLRFGREPGRKDSGDSVRLTVRPLKATGNAEDIVLYKAVVESVDDIGFNSEDDRIVNVTFKGLVDESRSDGDLIGFMNVPS